ncbi:MAG: hypothetical protein OEZ58_13625 [Gammaproteobacteria bacterium]|nr:hypothetical protein [Gammaproteobacteria bacterium]
MRIILEKNPQPSQVAYDDTDGKFYLNEDQEILYIGPGESKPWYVNANLSDFIRSVTEYESYCANVSKPMSEDEQLKIVREFTRKLQRIEDFEKKNRSYWECIIEQAEHGQI